MKTIEKQAEEILLATQKIVCNFSEEEKDQLRNAIIGILEGEENN